MMCIGTQAFKLFRHDHDHDASTQVASLIILSASLVTGAATSSTNTPSGPYRQRPGQHVWTDGSMITLDEVQLTGYMPDFIRFNFSVGGPATSQRGEMAAAAGALELRDPNIPLTIYTD
eukprot:753509-Rhodomonas_salina.1